MGGHRIIRLVALACLAGLLWSAGAPAQAGTRVERQSYVLGLDAGHACEVGIGGACFDLRPTDRYVTLDIVDASGQRADALYQFTDRYGALHGTGPVCGRSRIRIPDGATDLDVFLQSATLSLLACAAVHGPAVATTGEVIARYETGTARSFPKAKIDTEQDCGPQLPASAGIAGVTDDGRTVGLDVLVLLDGVDKTVAKRAMWRVDRSYRPLDVDIRVHAYRPVKLSSNDAPALISQAKALFGGVVPKGIDVVYTMTGKDITALGQAAVAGLADCIGGVRWPNRAFAVGEVVDPLPLDPFPLTFYSEGTARVAGHEIGHLMGAQHEHANCLEGIADLSADDPTPCTLMSNFADFVSDDFGTLDGAVVRGHAVSYALP